LEFSWLNDVYPPQVQDALIQALPSFKHLEAFGTTSLTEPLLQYCAQHRSLTLFFGSILFDAAVPRALPNTVFPAIKTLHLGGSIDLHQTVLPGISSGHLSDLSLQISNREQIGELMDGFKPILNIVERFSQTLQSLRIRHNRNRTVDRILASDMLRPLYSCRKLKTLRFQIRTFIDLTDDDVAAMIQAWPNLEIL
jgi:hypothetical protein